MDLYYKRTRVFWHEFGHYVAGDYNKKYFEKFGTDSIEIIKSEYNGGFDYRGRHTPSKPIDYKENAPIEHPASMLASNVYGCFFQSIYQKTSFDSCFNFEQPGVNGFDDYKKAWTVANRFGLTLQEKQELEKCIKDQFEAIKNNEEFKELFETDLSEYIGEDGDLINLPLEKIEQQFQSFLSTHERAYKEFVSKLEKIFENHTYSDPFTKFRNN